MFNFLKRKAVAPISDAEKGLVYAPYQKGSNPKDIERLFMRLFLTEDGQRALSYLQMITFQRALGPGATEAQLRYLEGQRSIVSTILRLMSNGRQS